MSSLTAWPISSPRPGGSCRAAAIGTMDAGSVSGVVIGTLADGVSSGLKLGNGGNIWFMEIGYSHPVLPVHESTGPYSLIPFQFSLIYINASNFVVILSIEK